MEWITLALAAGAFLLSGALLALYLKDRKKENSSSTPSDVDLNRFEEQVGSLRNALFELKGSMPGTVNEAVAGKMGDVQKALREAAETDQKRMLSLQTSLMDTLQKFAQGNASSILAFQQTFSDAFAHSMGLINQKLEASILALNQKVDASLQNGFKGTAESMEKLQKALGEIDAAQKNMQALSGEVLSLKGILTNSQQRGRYGEMQLEMILQSMFGEAYRGELYEFQYVLTGGESGLRPDAVVFLDGEARKQTIAIDAKFSLTGYEGLFGENKGDVDRESLKKAFKTAIQTQVKQVQKYVDSGKVIRPAIMFIPNDGIFAYIQNEFPDVVEDARQRFVLLASPTILQPIIAAFRVVQLDAKRTKNLEKITESLNALGKEFGRFTTRWDKIQRSVGSLSKATEEFDTTVRKMDKKFTTISRSDVKELPVDDGGSEPVLGYEE